MTVEEKIQSILITEHNFTKNLNFSWKDHSWAVAEHCPQYFNPKKYDWENNSDYVAKYCAENLDPRLYNWNIDSWALLFYNPNHKYLNHCIWSIGTIESLKDYILLQSSVWEKYRNQIDDLLDPTKREILLTKIAKDVKISKI